MQNYLLMEKIVVTGLPSMKDNTALVKVIIRIAIKDSSVYERRWHEVIRTVKTLAYYEIAIKKTFVKPKTNLLVFTRLQYLKFKGIPFTGFAKATIKNLEELAEIMGLQEICSLSQNNKGKVPVGLTSTSM